MHDGDDAVVRPWFMILGVRPRPVPSRYEIAQAGRTDVGNSVGRIFDVRPDLVIGGDRREYRLSAIGHLTRAICVATQVPNRI